MDQARVKELRKTMQAHRAKGLEPVPVNYPREDVSENENQGQEKGLIFESIDQYINYLEKKLNVDK
jgi:hypothetical protein